MNRRNVAALRPKLSVLLALSGMLLATMVGCAPAALVDVWRNPSVARPRLKKILVISMCKDATRQRMWEDAFATELSKYGVTATQSYRLCRNVAGPDTELMRSCLNTSDFDGILMIAPLTLNTDKEYVPSSGTTGPSSFTPYWDHYDRSWWYYKQPGKVDTLPHPRNEVDVYLVDNGREAMVWSGTSNKTDPATLEEVLTNVATPVAADLAEQAIIPTRE
ncbi:MAG TPA: hypothetical protein VMH22_06225 [bacterium]|nr:hypothetical protein [bacterium]